MYYNFTEAITLCDIISIYIYIYIYILMLYNVFSALNLCVFYSYNKSQQEALFLNLVS
jgi:hypothetical protein